MFVVTVYHYTKKESGLSIFANLMLRRSPTGTFGAGVYVTDVAPTSTKSRIARAIFDRTPEYSQQKVTDGE